MKKRLMILTCMLLITTAFVACTGLYLKQAVLKPLHLYEDKSVVEVPFVIWNDPVVRYAITAHNKQGIEAVAESLPMEQIPAPTEERKEITSAPPTEPPSVEITEQWFDDALFIGDSRTVGLRDFARLGQADYFCSVGMSVFGIMDATESDVNFSETTLKNLLQEKKYNKIYISLGLNDCNAPYDLLMDAYAEFLYTVRQLQPDAVIILQSIITLGREKASSEWYFSLENLKQVDAGIRDFADGHHVVFIDANTHFADEAGYLPDEMSFDGCHFEISGYQAWARWIMENAKTLHISFG